MALAFVPDVIENFGVLSVKNLFVKNDKLSVSLTNYFEDYWSGITSK